MKKSVYLISYLDNGEKKEKRVKKTSMEKAKTYADRNFPEWLDIYKIKGGN